MLYDAGTAHVILYDTETTQVFCLRRIMAIVITKLFPR